MRHNRTTPVERSCRQCGGNFTALQAEIRRGGGKFCGRPCYERSISKPRQTVEERFWSKVARRESTHCWLWQKSFRAGGYGSFRWDVEQLAHRAAWVLTFGPVPDGMDVCHRCDNPPCCNPSHLFLGSRGENNADRHVKGRSNSAHGEQNGNAKLTPDAIAAIREARARGVHLIDLAAEHGVSISTVHAVATRITWRTVS